MFCNRCGNKLPPESAFCNRCGAKVVSVDNAPRVTPPPVPFRRVSRRPSVLGSKPEEEASLEEEYEEPVAEEDYYEDYEVVEEYEEPEPVEDQIIFQITPAFWEVGARYFVAILLSLIVTAIITLVGGPVWLSLAFALAFLARPIYYHIEHNHTVYTLTMAKVEIQGGVFSRKSHNIPLHHVQDVTVSETFKERLIGIGDILIDSAALDEKIPMNNISNPRKYAELILNQAQLWH